MKDSKTKNIESEILKPAERASERHADGFIRDENNIVRSNFLTSGVNALSLEILDHGYFFGDESWNQFGVISPFARLYFMAKDYGWIETELGSIDLKPGQMYIIPPFVKVNLRTNHRLEKFYLHVSCHYGGLDLLEGMRECKVLPLANNALEELLEYYEGKTLQDLLMFKSAVFGIVGEFVRTYWPSLHERLRVAQKYKDVHAYIAQKLDFKLNYKDVALHCGYSPDVLRQHYVQDTGVTLAYYIQSQVLQSAALELLNSDASIKEISAKLGFNDEFYFSRFFKKRMQYSPREYRRINGFNKGAKS